MNLKDILNTNSSDIRDLLCAIEKAGENINDSVEQQRSTLFGETYLNNNEVCKMLRLSQRTLQDYRDKGLIAFYKLEGKILYKLSDVRQMLEQNYFDAWKQRR